MTVLVGVLTIAAVASVVAWLVQHRAWTTYDRNRPEGWGE